jgi:hypothetical protein
MLDVHAEVVLHRGQPCVGRPRGEDEAAPRERAVKLRVEGRNRDVGERLDLVQDREGVAAGPQLLLGERVVRVVARFDAQRGQRGGEAHRAGPAQADPEDLGLAVEHANHCWQSLSHEALAGLA